MSGGITIVLPSDIFNDKSKGDREELLIGWAGGSEACRVLLSERGKGDGKAPFLAVYFIAEPQAHGVIKRRPTNLFELDALLAGAGVSLLDYLREKLSDWNQEPLLKKKLLLVVACPLSRGETQTIEATNLWAFVTASTVAEVGVAIGIWEKSPDGKGLGHVLTRDPDANGSNIGIDIMSPQLDLTRGSAASASGWDADTRKVVAVGVGSLGSQVVRLLAQAGFGIWTLIDEDVLLPHNTARHAMGGAWVGWPKVAAMAFEIDRLYESAEKTVAIQADVLNLQSKREGVEEALTGADTILDFAASIPVSRWLANLRSATSRRVSMFLNPRGSDLVMLAEDLERHIQLDCLEMQYYRAIANTTDLGDHFKSPEGRIRYARSCRDVTMTIPNQLPALHAAIGANAIRCAVAKPGAEISIWKSDEQTGEVKRLSVPITGTQEQKLGEWTLIVDEHVIQRLSDLRMCKLPNETGGVLIGSYDLARKTVYVVDTVPSPPDSVAWPTMYIRGSAGLADEVKRINSVTDGQLEYVGEWHSHPDGCSCLPSEDDILVFSWLTENMGDAGLPALMAIAGQHRKVAWFLGQILRAGGWESSL
jgi:hypothetical protein